MGCQDRLCRSQSKAISSWTCLYLPQTADLPVARLRIVVHQALQTWTITDTLPCSYKFSQRIKLQSSAPLPSQSPAVR